MISQIPLPSAGAIESWLVSAAAVVSLALLAKNLFIRKPPIEAEFVTKAEFRAFRDHVQRDLEGVRDKIEERFVNLGEKIEGLKAELLTAGERRASGLHQRLTELEAGLARVDERTLKR